MGLKMIRQPSEAPNVFNIDDIVPMRYAYGNQDGYVIGKGQELKLEPFGSGVKINSGRVVLQGVETDVNADGVQLEVIVSPIETYYSVYYAVDLNANETYIRLSEPSTSGYPTIPTGQDLTVNQIGYANLELYRFTATNGIISNITKVVKPIKYTPDMQVASAKMAEATKISGEELKKDENGVLKVGNIIIPQKKLIFKNGNGLSVSSGEVFTHTESLTNKTLEIVFRLGVDDFNIHHTKITMGDINSNQGDKTVYTGTPYSISGGYTLVNTASFSTASNTNKLIATFKSVRQDNASNTLFDGYVYKVYEIIE